MKDYLRLDKNRDIIELPLEHEFDINGWDLSKARQLLHNLNPMLFEWPGSPIKYVNTDFCILFDTLKNQSFSRKEITESKEESSW